MSLRPSRQHGKTMVSRYERRLDKIEQDNRHVSIGSKEWKSSGIFADARLIIVREEASTILFVVLAGDWPIESGKQLRASGGGWMVVTICLKRVQSSAAAGAGAGEI